MTQKMEKLNGIYSKKKKREAWRYNFTFTSLEITRKKENQLRQDSNLPAWQAVDIAEDHLELAAALNGQGGPHVGRHGIGHVAEDGEGGGAVPLQLSEDGAHRRRHRCCGGPGGGHPKMGTPASRARGRGSHQARRSGCWGG